MAEKAIRPLSLSGLYCFATLGPVGPLWHAMGPGFLPPVTDCGQLSLAVLVQPMPQRQVPGVGGGWNRVSRNKIDWGPSVNVALWRPCRSWNSLKICSMKRKCARACVYLCVRVRVRACVRVCVTVACVCNVCVCA